MKKLLSILAIAAIFGACTNNKTKKCSDEAANQEKCSMISVDSFLVIAANNVGKELTVMGTVEKVCKVDGKRIKLKSSTSCKFLKGEASEQIGSFKPELEGSDVCLVGTVVETMIDSATVNQWEAKAKEGCSKIEPKEKACADSTGKCNMFKKYRDDIAASPNGYIMQYSLNVTKYHPCATADGDGCGKHSEKAAGYEKQDTSAQGCCIKTKNCCKEEIPATEAEKKCCDK